MLLNLNSNYPMQNCLKELLPPLLNKNGATGSVGPLILKELCHAEAPRVVFMFLFIMNHSGRMIGSYMLP